MTEENCEEEYEGGTENEEGMREKKMKRRT